MAIPTNFSHAFQRIDHAGTVHVRLTWMSSTGTLNELSDCEFREEVTYRIRKQSRLFGGFNFENHVILP